MRKNIFAVINEKINASNITKNKIAKFAPSNDAQGMNNQNFDIVSGSWSVEDSDLYSPSGSRLEILTAGVYEVSIHFHGYIVPGSYCEEILFSGALGGIVTHSQIIGHPTAAIQGIANASVVTYIPANTTVELQAYTSDLNNYIYGSAISNQNKVIVTKLS